MKFFAALLSFYVLLLTLQPVLAAIDFRHKKECCSDCSKHDCEKQSPKKQQQNNSTESMCNPFQSCAICGGYIIAERQVNFVAVHEAGTFTPAIHEAFISGFISDCFHPPKNV